MTRPVTMDEVKEEVGRAVIVLAVVIFGLTLLLALATGTVTKDHEQRIEHLEKATELETQ